MSDGRAAAGSHLIRGSLIAAIAVGTNGLGGFVFWALAARWEQPDAVGGAQELFTATLVVTYLTSLGLPVAVAHFCPDRGPDATAFFRVAVVATTLTSILGAAGLVATASDGLLRPLAGIPVVARVVLLGAVISGLSCAVLAEIRLLALRRWSLVMLRVGVVVVIRIPLLAAVRGRIDLWAFLVVAGAPAASGLVTAAALWWRHGPAPVVRDQLRVWSRYSAVNWLSLLGSQGPQFLVPLIVALGVRSGDFAPFYLAWGATAIFFLVPHMAGQTMLAECGKPGADHHRLVRATLLLCVTLTTLVAACSFAAATPVRLVFGSDYGLVADLLPWMLWGLVPWSGTAVALAQARARSASGTVLAITTAYLAVTLVGVTAGVISGGAQGAAIGWFLANAATGLAVLPTLVPALRAAGAPSLVLAAAPPVDGFDGLPAVGP